MRPLSRLGGGQSEEVITLGLGAELRPWQNVGRRAGYEHPLTHGEVLFGYRWTLSAVLRF